MLLTRAIAERIRDGEVDLQFRRWRKPTVKAGGRLRSMVGELAIGAVDVIEADQVRDEDARRAGAIDAATMLAELFRDRGTSHARARTARPDDASRLYRIEVAYAGVDARAALRESLPDADALRDLLARLDGFDRRSGRGAWTMRTLELIAAWPGRRAPELAELHECETLPWKADVRKLKELGLTESLTVGYRVSPRGEQVLTALRARDQPGSSHAV